MKNINYKSSLLYNCLIIKHLKPKLCFYFLLSLSFSANGFTLEQERWLNSDDTDDTSHVNEGKLEFIKKPELKEPLHSYNKLIISPRSVESGWVDIQQCYRHLDVLEELEITYSYNFINKLTITSKQNIKSATVQKQTIQLVDIKPKAEICISAEVRIFYQNPDLTFTLVNGPYHRRFLDGYYPYHVTLDISYPDTLLFLSSKPVKQNGFAVTQGDNKIFIDSYFEGILKTEVLFKLVN